MRIAIIDDDPVEHVILRELGGTQSPDAEFDGFTRLDDFLAAGPERYDHVFLDRCLPPYEDYGDTLPALGQSGYAGHIILMTADAPPVDTSGYCFRVTGPVDKIALLEPGRLAACLQA
jgi:hypothetical protein